MAKISTPNFEGFMYEYEARSDQPSEFVGELKELLSKHRVVKLIPGWHVSDLRAFYDEITEKLGKPMNIAEDYAQAGAQTGERWMEIRYDEDIPDMSAYRHSKNAQPLHTDESYIEDPCDVMVFYCKNKAPLGGETLFVDGPKLVERMKIVDPELLEQLSSTEICYEKSGNLRKEKIINLDNPQSPQFNYNYYCLSPNESEQAKELNKKFLAFLETHVKGSFLEVSVGLNPGEGVFWWDHYLVHGRNPFIAEKTNDRYIWKTGIRWD